MMRSRAARNLTETVVHGASVGALGYVLSQTLTLAFYLTLARLVTPSEFGTFAAGSVFVGIGMVFAGSGMRAALVQRRDRIEEALNTALVATVLAGVGLGLVGLALSPLVGLFFGNSEIGLVAAAVSGYFLLRQANVVPDALMQRRFSFVRRVVLDPATALAFGVTAVALAGAGMGVWALVLGTYASAVVDVILTWSLARWRPSPRLASLAMWRQLVGFGRYVVAAELLARVSNEISTALLGRFVGTAALGHYQYAHRVALRPHWALVDSVSYVLFPAFARISHDEERFREAFLRTLRWVSIVAFPLSLVLFSLGEPIVLLLFGERWGAAGTALMAMSLSTAGYAFGSLASEVHKAAGRPSFLPRMHATELALAAAFMAALLPFGLTGIAAALSLQAVGVGLYGARASSRLMRLPVSRLLVEVWPPAAAAVAMAAVVLAADRLVVEAGARGAAVGLPLLAVEGLLATVTYLAVLFALKPRTVGDLLAVVRSSWAHTNVPAAVREAAASTKISPRSTPHS